MANRVPYIQKVTTDVLAQAVFDFVTVNDERISIEVPGLDPLVPLNVLTAIAPFQTLRVSKRYMLQVRAVVEGQPIVMGVPITTSSTTQDLPGGEDNKIELTQRPVILERIVAQLRKKGYLP